MRIFGEPTVAHLGFVAVLALLLFTQRMILVAFPVGKILRHWRDTGDAVLLARVGRITPNPGLVAVQQALDNDRVMDVRRSGHHAVNQWEEMMPPPQGSTLDSYLTAITPVDGQLVQIIDVEKIMAEMRDQDLEISAQVRAKNQSRETRSILVMDDSSVARNQIQHTLEQIGLRCVLANDGMEALGLLEKWARKVRSPSVSA